MEKPKANFLSVFILLLLATAALIVSRWTYWFDGSFTGWNGPLCDIHKCGMNRDLASFFLWVCFPLTTCLVILAFLDAFKYTTAVPVGLKRLVVFIRIDFSLLAAALSLASLLIFGLQCGLAYPMVGRFQVGFWALVVYCAILASIFFYQSFHSIRKGFFSEKIKYIMYDEEAEDSKVADDLELAADSEMKRMDMDEEFKVDVDKDLDKNESEVDEIIVK
eukprot:GAHX01000609.1.p1 GENE.GAHX01000609.1~~GAHX01000609.1.p1  ORF type:complete len:220 (-),score=30.39 GAHX01000609.1:33-692(-)